MYMITVQDDKPTSADKHSGTKVAQRKTAEFRSVKVGQSKGFLQGMVLKLILQECLGISHISNGEIIINDRKYSEKQFFFSIFLFLMVSYLPPLFQPQY